MPARYDAALRSGDLDAAYKMTSRLSFDWAENRRDFLLRTRFRPTEEATTKPLRFLPQISLAYLLSLTGSARWKRLRYAARMIRRSTSRKTPLPS